MTQIEFQEALWFWFNMKAFQATLCLIPIFILSYIIYKIFKQPRMEEWHPPVVIFGGIFALIFLGTFIHSCYHILYIYLAPNLYIREFFQ